MSDIWKQSCIKSERIIQKEFNWCILVLLQDRIQTGTKNHCKSLQKKEWNKLNNQRSYRSPAAILKKLAESTMCSSIVNIRETQTNITPLMHREWEKMLTQHILNYIMDKEGEGPKAMEKLVTLCPEVKTLVKSKEEKHSLELLYPIVSLFVSRTSILC